MAKANNVIDVSELRDKVLASDDIKYDEVHVDEWDVTLPVKTLSSKELEKVTKSKDNHFRMLNVAVIYGCKTKDGEQVFKEEDLAKFETEKSFGAIQKVATKILELSGFYESAEKEAKNG